MSGRRLVLAACAVALLAGCSSDSSSKSSGTGPRSWTLAQILQDTGLKRGSDGLTYTLPGHPECTAHVLLRSTAEVQTYTNSGDPIATNPDKSAGVRVDPNVPGACRGLFTQAFAKVK
jgi:hypothetical protein